MLLFNYRSQISLKDKTYCFFWDHSPSSDLFCNYVNVCAFSSNFCQRFRVIKLVVAANPRTLAVCKGCMTVAGVTTSHSTSKNASLSVTGEFITEETEDFSILALFPKFRMTTVNSSRVPRALRWATAGKDHPIQRFLKRSHGRGCRGEMNTGRIRDTANISLKRLSCPNHRVPLWENQVLLALREA